MLKINLSLSYPSLYRKEENIARESKLTIEQKLRKILYQIIVENKEHGLGTETNFDFKYIPNYDVTSTALGEYDGSGLQQPGIERRNFNTLILASAVLATVSYFGMKTTWGFVGLVKWRLGF